jgi:hypothetical protein
MTKLKAQFEISSWDEVPFDEGGRVGKLTEALVGKTYTGDISGTSTTKWLMAYAPDKSATFVGLERIRGAFGGRRGTLVVSHEGTFRDGAARATLMVVSGTGALKSVAGRGRFLANPAGSITLTLTDA